MQQILITDNFTHFVANYGVDENSILETFNAPDKSQRISDTRTLFYKNFPGKIKPHLLVCIKQDDYENRLSFAFWLPEHTLMTDSSLEETLASFCDTFGCTISIGKISSTYIERAELHNVTHDNIYTQITIDVWKDTLIFRHYIAKLRWANAYLTHIFAINQYKYLRWYRDVQI